MSPSESDRLLAPPAFPRLAGHPVRWGLLTELAQSDRRVSELCDRLGLNQSLVSYHLSQLRSEQMVSRRRSTADGRDSYYRLDLERCGELLLGTGAALHPGLRLIRSPNCQAPPAGRQPVRVLFSCTGNSARSQIAEALAEQLGHGRLVAMSGGSHPKPLHANAVRVMREYGIDLTGRSSKPLSQFSGQRFDYVITLCDRVREVCPEFPGHPSVIHWSTPDPGREGDTDEDTYPAFEHTANEVATRIRLLIESIDATPNRSTGRAVSTSTRGRPRR